MKLRLARVAGAVAALVGAAFVVRALSAHWSATRHFLATAEPGWLASGFVLAVTAMVAMALPWRSAQRLLGSSLGRFDTVTLYFIGEIGKYVPGAVWAAIGRAELAGRRGTPRPVAYAGVGLSLCALYLACALVAAVAFVVASERAATHRMVWVLGVLPLGAGLLHPRVLGLVLPAPPPWAEVLRLVLRYVPAWLLAALATVSIVRALTPEFDPPEIVLATTLAWLAGFLAVGAPGGAGVREAVFLSLAPGLPDGAALAAALLARTAFVTADAVGAAGAHLARRIRVTQTADGKAAS